jgi:hypothetical protein
MIIRNLNKNHHLDHVLLVFPSVFSANSKNMIMSSIIKKLELENMLVTKTICEESCFVFKVNDIVEAACSIKELFGIDRVAIAKQVPNIFSDVISAIITTGKQIILPKQKYFIKVQISKEAKVNYVGRDIAFVSSGDLIEQLASTGAHPARNESEADKIILSYIGKDYGYTCFQIDKAHGGMPFGYQNMKVACSIHNVLSAISSLMAIKSGFVPELLILYTSYDELTENVKLFGHIANRMPLKRHNLRIAQIDLSDEVDQDLKFILKESISTKILVQLPEKGVVLPLSAMIYPSWFIELIMYKITLAKKTPWVPLMLLTDEIRQAAKVFGLEEKLMSIDNLIISTVFKKKDYYRKHLRKVDVLSKKAMKNMKTISLKVGPNYLHDIIDAI